MAALGVTAVGAVALVTTRLGRGRAAVPPVRPLPSPTSIPTQTAAAAEGPIVMIPRAAWGAANPSVTPDGVGESGPFQAVSNPNGWLVYDQPPAEVLNTIIIHHSALPLTDGPLAIQKLHKEEKGFADIGYQYLIDEKGRLFEGRALNVRGAHTLGANYGSVGICLIGNFEEIQPSAPQLRVLPALIAALIGQFPKITRMAGHRDYNPGATLCPGQNLYPLLPGLAQAQGLRYGTG